MRKPIVPLLALIFTWNPARCADWPHFLGPTRDGRSTETGLLREWPKDGPARVWERAVGTGYSGPAVAGDNLILFHRVDDRETVECLNARTGKLLWKHSSATGYVDDFNMDDGPRAVPIIAGDHVYTVGAEGLLSCLDLATGKLVWKVTLDTAYPVRKSYFGVGASPLVDGDRIFVNAGSKGAGVVAFDRKTGKELWKATDHRASYATPTVADIDGRRRLLFVTREGLLVLDPKDGTVVHTRAFRARIDASVNAATPIVSEGHVFLSASYNTGALLLESRGWTDIWKSDEILSNHYTTSVKVGDHLYGIHGRQEYGPELRCVEWKTGKVAWSQKGFGCAWLIAADGLLIASIDSGELALIEASPTAFRELARCTPLSKPVRALPALANGLLYQRDSKKLVALRIGK